MLNDTHSAAAPAPNSTRLATHQDHVAARARPLHLEDDTGPRWSVLSAIGDLAAPPTGALRDPDGARLDTRLVPVPGHSVSLLHKRMTAAIAEHVVGVAA